MLRLLPLCVLLLPSVGVAQNTWYVPDDFPTIQAGIDGSANGDTVVVRDGTYVENINFNGKAITLASENGPLASIIDGNQSGSVVMFDSGEGPTTVLNGFTLRNGRANWGGGVHCDNSSPTLNNCRVIANKVLWDGAGIYCSAGSSPALTNCSFVDNDADELPASDGGGMYCAAGSSPTLDNCSFVNNIASSEGGGICLDVDVFSGAGSSATLNNCVFTGNGCPYGGGAILCRSSSLTLVNCTFKGNSANISGGGGICFYSGSSGTLDNCVFEDNYADWEGGGVSCYTSSPTFKNCVFKSNEAVFGGGMACKNSSPFLSNCVFKDNDAVYGGGLDCQFSGPALDNCTFTGNAASIGSGMHATGSPAPTLRNCIVWGNVPTNIEGAVDGATYSCIQGGLGHPWFGAGCIDTDPLFASGPVGDLYLGQTAAGQSAASPCVDSGDPAVSAFGSTRTDHVADSGLVDMGFHCSVGGGSPPILSVANLIAGQAASVHVTGSTAGGKVFVAYSLAGGGPFSSSHGTLLLSPPIEVLNYQIADSLGFAAWNVPVPPGASGVNVWLQAWDKGSLTLSNGLAMTVQ